MEPRDTLWQWCLRELEEEPALQLSTDTLQTALQGVEVFDHPDRSLRGRAMSHVFVFPYTRRPAAPRARRRRRRYRTLGTAGDLPGLETQMFEDHFHVLRRCLARFGTAGLPVALP